MKSLKVKIENCYGIKHLEYDFNFEKSKSYSIYAPNGFMKTSFSKTLSDLSKKKESGDLVFPSRTPKRDVLDEFDVEIKPENLFVIEPYNQDFSSDKTSLLLVNQNIKSQYDNALLKIEKKKDALFSKLKQLSGLTGRTITPETELLKLFNKSYIFDLLEEMESNLTNFKDERLSSIEYGKLFNKDTLSLLESGEIKRQLKEYIEKYNDLIDKSPVLNKTFNHYHAKNIQKNLTDNGFFTANHSVGLFNGKEREQIDSSEKLNIRIEEEKKKILSNEELLKKFEAIENKLSNKELRSFRDYLFENQDIVVKLSEYEKLQKDIWLAYFANQRDPFLELMKEYKIGKEVIQQAIKTAKEEKTEWMEVVELFNKRFSVPFKIEVSNQADVILKNLEPQLSFKFLEENEEPQLIERESLLKVLSQGEKRALYILNILFELNGRLKRGIKTLLIVDDIADSFDYKNKYAIVEYLKEISENSDFYTIFLTHNFDFHRTLSGRLNIPRKCRLFAVKNDGILSLAEEKYQKNPFEHWKSNLHNSLFIISSIPFVRNLAEYCGYDTEFLKLTSLLHSKTDTITITIKDLEGIYKTILKDKSSLILTDHKKIVIDLIFEIAESILSEPNETAELESKIVLSIAIRLKAEQFMIRKIADKPFSDGITSNQTSELLKRFKKDFSLETDAIKLLEQVNLMTPENIHLNSFMYEPILDMSPEHLKKLYVETKGLT